MTHRSRSFQPSRRSLVPPFEVMDVLDRVAVLRAAGRDVISLCAGEPSGGAPTAVSRAAARLHMSGQPLTYTSALGIRPLREGLAAHYARWYGLDVDPVAPADEESSRGDVVVEQRLQPTAGERGTVGHRLEVALVAARTGQARHRHLAGDPVPPSARRTRDADAVAHVHAELLLT